MPSHYLAKSEPLPRLENGHDVSFPLSTLASSPTQRTHWEGVRNAVAGKTLRNMHIGDRVLFYHSNCKLPGVAGEVEVCGEPVVDECAFQVGHPYEDKRSRREEPRWYMPEVKYLRTFPHFIPLALLQHLASPTCPDALDYLDEEQLQAIRGMDLLKKGRLSVQHVSAEAYEAVCRLGEKGGWESWRGKWNAGGGGAGAGQRKETAAVKGKGEEDGKKKKRKAREPEQEQGGSNSVREDVKAAEEEPPTTRRRSARNSKP